MVRYLIIKGHRVKLLPAAIPPEEDLHCPKCQTKFDSSVHRRACLELCGHLVCLPCISKMNVGCEQCASADAVAVTTKQSSQYRGGNTLHGDDDDDLVILDHTSASDPHLQSPPLSPQPVLVLSSVLGRAPGDDEDAFPEIQRLSLTALPILEYMPPPRQSLNYVPIVIALDDNDELESEKTEVPIDGDKSPLLEESKKKDIRVQETSAITIKAFSDDEDDDSANFEPHRHRVLRQRRKSQCYTSKDLEGNISTHAGASEFGNYRCKHCSLSFVEKVDLGRHMYQAHWDIRPYPCEICDWPFTNQRNLQNHMLTHTDERPFQCTNCDSAFNRQYTLDNHLQKVHRIKRSKQGPKSKKKKRISKANNNVQDKEEPQPIPSPWITVKLIRLDAQGILKAKENLKTTPPPLSFGSYDEEQKENMVKMLKDHGAPMTAKGALLNKIFAGTHTTISELRRKRYDENKEDRQFSCMHCQQVFRGKTKLATHMRNFHSDHRPYACDLCGWCFSQRNKLVMHRITHTIDRPHKCKQCEATFNRKYSLERHVRIMHLKTPRKSEAAENKPCQKKPARCPYCKGEYETREIMAKHMKQAHADMRPHICPICQFPFGRRKHLNSHMKCAHSNNKPFECIICQSKYNRRFSLERHMVNVHGIRIRLHPHEAPKDGDEYCPECQSLFGIDDCTKVAYAGCGHISCTGCVIRAELGCGQCTLDNAPRTWSPDPKSLTTTKLAGPQFLLGQIEKLNFGADVVMDVQEDVMVCGEEKQKDFQESLKVNNDTSLEKFKTVTKESGTKTYCCIYCKEPFTKKVDLGLHLQNNHADVRPFPCDICDWPFSSSKDLDRHRMIHTNDRPFRCYLCAVTFNRKSTRDRHVEKIHLKWRRI